MHTVPRPNVTAAALRRAILCTVVAVAPGCGDDAPTDGGAGGNTLTFTRQNSTTVAFAGGAVRYVWCGEWESGLVPAQTVHVWVGGPSAGNPYWYLQAVIADVTIGQPLTFPNSFVWDQPTEAHVFLSDPTNELSTAESGASGSVTFEALNCTTGQPVRFSANAVLGSEVGGPTVTMSGTFEATVGAPPPWY